MQYAAGRLNVGDAAGAADALGKLLRANARLAEAHHILGQATAALGRLADAEAAFRAALALAPAFAPAAVALSELLVGTDRAEEAHALLAPFVAGPAADIFVLTADANALKSLRRYDQAISQYARAKDVAPSSGVAEHNLAGVLGDVQRYAESEEATARALAKGLDAPETWLVRARALQGLGRMDEAVDAYSQAVRRRSSYDEAHGDLAQLVWMLTEDAGAASRALDLAIQGNPNDIALRLRKAAFVEYAAGAAAAFEALNEAPAAVRAAPMVKAFLAKYATRLDPALALKQARSAYADMPEEQNVIAALCQAEIASGEPEAAARTASQIRERWSLNQQGIALLATAWRMMGDDRYRELYDYDALVQAHEIDTPEGWSSLDGFLSDLGEAVGRTHRFRAHPIGQSVRFGSQSQLGPESPDPVIRAFFSAIEGPIRRHIEGLGHGQDVLRRRITGAHQFNGAWSVRLRPGGFHADHVHPMGWLSSACYIALPDAVSRGREGWIRFGEPGLATAEPLAAEHHVQPEPGRLVLFPSYMWHGTVPFTGDQPRLTVAFDLLPA